MHASGRKEARRLRAVAVVGLACIAAGVGDQAFLTINAPRPMGLMGSASVEWYWLPGILLFCGWIAFCLCVPLEFAFLENLAHRIGDRTLARTCRWTGSGAAVSSLLLLYGIDRILHQWETLGIFAVIVPIWFIFQLWTALINLDFAIRLSRFALVKAAEKYGWMGEKTT